jgi:hypothetical protein
MKKLSKNPIITSLLCTLIVSIVGFFISMKVALAIYDERFANAQKYFELIINRLDSIEKKIDHHIEIDK